MGCEGTPPFCRSWGTSGTFELLPGHLCSLPSVYWPHPAIPKDGTQSPHSVGETLGGLWAAGTLLQGSLSVPKTQRWERAKAVVNWGPPGPGPGPALSGRAWTWCGSGLRSPSWLWQSEQAAHCTSPCLCFPGCAGPGHLSVPLLPSCACGYGTWSPSCLCQHPRQLGSSELGSDLCFSRCFFGTEGEGNPVLGSGTWGPPSPQRPSPASSCAPARSEAWELLEAPAPPAYLWAGKPT